MAEVSAEVRYAIGTLVTWVAWFCVARSAWLLLKLFWRVPGTDAHRLRASLALFAGTAGVGLLVGHFVLAGLVRGAERSVQLPIVWFVMPFAAWAAVAFVCAAGYWLARAMFAVESRSRSGARLNVVLCLCLAALAIVAFRGGAAPITILKGSIPISFQVGLSLIALAIAALVAMAVSQRAVATRNVLRGLGTQLALLVGSVLFGLPFAWLLLTSFKEDRDMASAEGLIWVPRVQQTVPYDDPDNPNIETTYEGNKVQGTIIESYRDGSAKLDIVKPMSLRGLTVIASAPLNRVPRQIDLVTGVLDGQKVTGKAIKDREDGRRVVEVISPPTLAGRTFVALRSALEPIRNVGLKWQNYPDALEFLPVETGKGLVYLKNTLILVVFNVIGTLLSSSLVAYAFARLRFPGKHALFLVLLSTMMLPAAVTLLPTFLIFRSLGWIDTLLPLWVPSFFGSAFNIFLLRQFFITVPMELEDAAKMDGCSYLRTFWQVMLPQVTPALAVVAIWTFMGAWNNFMGPLVYINSPENMPISYALQLFNSERSGEPGYLMAFATMSITPVIALFFFAQRYFIEGVQLSGLGGK